MNTSMLERSKPKLQSTTAGKAAMDYPPIKVHPSKPECFAGLSSLVYFGTQVSTRLQIVWETIKSSNADAFKTRPRSAVSPIWAVGGSRRGRLEHKYMKCTV